MTDLDKALTDITSIRRQVAQSTEFRGYGPLTLGLTAAIALFTGLAQARWVRDPAAHPTQYVALWLTTGLLCAALIATQMLKRTDRMHRGMAEEMVRIAVAQFLPAAITGLILPLVLLHVSGAVFWVLPGLWQIVFSLGVFASCRCLPRALLLVGAWFLLTGLGCITLGGDRALAPFTMAGAYSVGMAMAAVLHLLAGRREATHDEEED